MFLSSRGKHSHPVGIWNENIVAPRYDVDVRRRRRRAAPALLDESRRALDELTRLLELPSVYPFQLDRVPV